MLDALRSDELIRAIGRDNEPIKTCVSTTPSLLANGPTLTLLSGALLHNHSGADCRHPLFI